MRIQNVSRRKIALVIPAGTVLEVEDEATARAFLAAGRGQLREVPPARNEKPVRPPKAEAAPEEPAEPKARPRRRSK